MQSNFMNSESGLADNFVDQRKDELRYGCKERRWYLRTPEGWVLDDTDLVFDMVRQFCRDAASGMSDKEKVWLGSFRTIRNVLWIARSYREIAVATIDDEERVMIN